MDTPHNWHALSINEVFQILHSSPEGISASQAKSLLNQHGLNQLPNKKRRSLLVSIFVTIFQQLNNVMNYVLIAAAIFAAITNHWIDFWVILLILVVNISIGLFHHVRSQKIVRSLSDSFVQECLVIRNGTVTKLDATQLVPGDVIQLSDGDKIPADVRFFETNETSSIESSLTGESQAVIKNTAEVSTNAPLAERSNMGYMGTILVTGEAKGIVVATGTHTEIGTIASSLETITEDKTLFEHRTDTLVKQMVAITFTVSTLIVMIGFFRNMPLADLILFGLATLISGIPEVLPTVLIVVLSIAALRMSKRQALLKKLSAIESLSTITTIITDKTGTLTENTMSVRTVILPDMRKIQVSGTSWEPKGDFLLDELPFTPLDDPNFKRLAELAGFNDQADVIQKNDAKGTSLWSNIGDPTEASRVVLSRKAGITAAHQSEHFTILHTIPYDQQTKYRQNIVLDKRLNKTLLVLLGGAEKIVERCNCSAKEMKAYQAIVSEYAAQTYRMQAIAYREIVFTDAQISALKAGNLSNDELLNLQVMKKPVQLLGILAIQDPIRGDVPDAVTKAQQAGIRVIMATGDHPATARAIGEETGILLPNQQVATDDMVSELSDQELLDLLKKTSVFARMTPSTKLRIATLLKKEGEVIAMTGDGTNDAPALKRADVGIAMGRIGTDAARESADLILLDDNFATIVAAIEEGRTVFRNVRQTSLFLLTTNFSEGLVILVSMAAGFALPLLPLQILWLNLVTDGISGVALAIEKPQTTTLTSAPRKKTDGILSKKNLIFILTIATLMTGGAVALFMMWMNTDLMYARTVAFVFLVFTNLFNMINLRSLDMPIYKIGFFSNRSITASFIISCVLMGVILLVPALRTVFQFSEISLGMISMLFLLSSTVFFVGELLKKAHTID